MRNKFLLIYLLVVFYAMIGCKSKATDPEGTDTTKSEKGWVKVWSDEFNYRGLPDSTKWGYDVGGSGWGNNELQYYTSKRAENARVLDSVLVIEARKEQWSNRNYTSARLVTRNKGDWTYGRFEIRAKLPAGRGTWPAIWMLPTKGTYGTGGWPDNGEIDIMEHVGYDDGNIHGSTHCKMYYFKIGTQKTATIRIPDATSSFHVYALEWNKDKIDMYVDNTKYFTVLNENKGWEAWPFDKDFHLILNIAIGGDWGGSKGVDDNIFPQWLAVDYVRVYKWVE